MVASYSDIANSENKTQSLRGHTCSVHIWHVLGEPGVGRGFRRAKEKTEHKDSCREGKELELAPHWSGMSWAVFHLSKEMASTVSV